MNKVLVNTSSYGLHLESEAFDWMCDNGFCDYYGINELPRHHPTLLECYGIFGCNFSLCNIELVDIDSDKYVIVVEDGREYVYTPKTIEWNLIEDEN